LSQRLPWHPKLRSLRCYPKFQSIPSFRSHQPILKLQFLRTNPKFQNLPTLRRLRCYQRFPTLPSSLKLPTFPTHQPGLSLLSHRTLQWLPKCRSFRPLP